MRLYIDLCCWNRPFDDTTQPRIRAEAAGLDVIIERISHRADHVLWSVYLDAELAAGPDPKRRQWIEEKKSLAAEMIPASTPIEDQACDLAGQGMAALDACHLAAAESQAEGLLTVDDRFLRQANRLAAGVLVKNPVEYCDEVSRGNP